MASVRRAPKGVSDTVTRHPRVGRMCRKTVLPGADKEHFSKKKKKQCVEKITRGVESEARKSRETGKGLFRLVDTKQPWVPPPTPHVDSEHCEEESGAKAEHSWLRPK